MPSFRTAALIAGVANALNLVGIGIRYRSVLTGGHDLGSLASVALPLLISIPTVGMLIALYWTDATLILSRRRRYAAIVLALFAGLPTIWQLYAIVQMLRSDWLSIREFEGLTVASQIAGWFAQSGVALDQLGAMLSWFGHQSIVFFLVILILRDGHQLTEVRGSDLLHDMAKLAVLVAAVTLTLGLLGQVYALLNYDYYHQQSPAQIGSRGTFTLRIVSGVVSGIPWAIFPLALALLILRSQVSADHQPPTELVDAAD